MGPEDVNSAINRARLVWMEPPRAVSAVFPKRENFFHWGFLGREEAPARTATHLVEPAKGLERTTVSPACIRGSGSQLKGFV